MAYKKEALEKLIKLVEEVSIEPENFWFKSKLLKILFPEAGAIATNKSIKEDTEKILEYLRIKPICSIDYSFIPYDLLRKRLEFDNLRMENIRYDMDEKDEIKRLYDFCILAFYQVENLLNFFYYEKFPNVDALLRHLESIPSTKFRRSWEQNVGDITISTKIFSFGRTYYGYKNDKNFTGFNIDNLRLIRNEGLHRCHRIMTHENENKRLYEFIKHATFDSVYSIVNSLSNKIKEILL